MEVVMLKRIAALFTTVMLVVAGSAHAKSATDAIRRIAPTTHPGVRAVSRPAARSETLWIFDADFEDLIGDNAGWDSEDWSGTMACSNYWHKDTIRIEGFEYLGDSTWWCGKYDDCWRQPRGYGNNWTCMLSRSFPEVAAVCEPGDELVLEYDQRWAIEACYDYGYTDISTDGGETWTTFAYVTNPGFACSQPGPSQGWNNSCPWGMCGHAVHNLSDYAGQAVELRFRFKSDSVYSSEDQWNNPPNNSCLDGAWQLDNIAWYVNGELVWLDDCESPGHNGWSTENTSGWDQTGVVYERRYEEFDGRAGWMMAAYDTTSGEMVPDQWSILFSPPIEVEGFEHVIAQWEGWVDLPDGGAYDDRAGARPLPYDRFECADRRAGQPMYWYGGMSNEAPRWITVIDTIPCIEDWLVLAMRAYGREQATDHGAGFVIDRLRVGVPLETGVDGGGTAAWVFPPRPSPFDDLTTVRFGVAVSGKVTLRVYDLCGRVVRTLVDNVLHAGPHVATWDGTTDRGTRAASGVYFIKMDAPGHGEGFRATRKLVLLR
jgi:hypothetical protein